MISAQRGLGTTVGFLGDGVNDAVALHDADVGVSVETATDMAKDAADIVLLEKDLGILAAAFLAVLASMVVIYVALIELGKRRFYRVESPGPTLSRRHSPRQRRLRHRASRWTSPRARAEPALWTRAVSSHTLGLAVWTTPGSDGCWTLVGR